MGIQAVAARSISSLGINTVVFTSALIRVVVYAAGALRGRGNPASLSVSGLTSQHSLHMSARGSGWNNVSDQLGALIWFPAAVVLVALRNLRASRQVGRKHMMMIGIVVIGAVGTRRRRGGLGPRRVFGQAPEPFPQTNRNWDPPRSRSIRVSRLITGVRAAPKAAQAVQPKPSCLLHCLPCCQCCHGPGIARHVAALLGRAAENLAANSHASKHAATDDPRNTNQNCCERKSAATRLRSA